MHLQLTWQGQILEFELEEGDTWADVAEDFAERIGAEATKVSFYVSPKMANVKGFMKHPFPSDKLNSIDAQDLAKLRIKAVGTPSAQVAKLDADLLRHAQRMNARQQARQASRSVKSNSNRDWQQIQDEAKYTFHAIEPLQYLPNPEKSKRYLERLASDPGIKASMRKHKFSVGLLTEMNPAEHTTHESKTLGLNRNRGEVIELRLRTDSYDGYRDYKVIRKTLCHELSHNIHSDHDRKFWDLTKQIEKEVDQNDHLHGGHKLSSDEFYVADDSYDESHADLGGWQGGEFVLGGTSSSQGLTRREIMARAAESRLRREREAVEREESNLADENRSAGS